MELVQRLRNLGEIANPHRQHGLVLLLGLCVGLLQALQVALQRVHPLDLLAQPVHLRRHVGLAPLHGAQFHLDLHQLALALLQLRLQALYEGGASAADVLVPQRVVQVAR